MGLPPLPPFFGESQVKCYACGKPSVRVLQGRGLARFACATCELPPAELRPPSLESVFDGPMKALDESEAAYKARVTASLPPLPSLPPLAPLPPLPKASDVARAFPTLAQDPEFIASDEYQAHAAASGYPGCPPARVLVADPPWSFDDATPHKGAEDHYKTMTVDEIKAFPLPPRLENGVLFLWRVAGGNEKGSLGEAAYDVCRAWGYTPKSEISWTKTLKCKTCDGKGWTPIKHPSDTIREACAELRVWCDDCHGRGHKISIGMGRYVRGAHEICIIATRGKGVIPDDKSVRSTFEAPRREHSEKPHFFYSIVRRLYPEGPHVELFARRRREGWFQFGDELPEAPIGLHARVAAVLDWPVDKVQSFSLQALRDLVRPVSEKLAHELTQQIQGGSVIVGSQEQS